MKKVLLALVIFSFFAFLSPLAFASQNALIEISPRGLVSITSQVLGASTKNGEDSTNLSEDGADTVQEIDLEKENDQVKVTTKTATGSAQQKVDSGKPLVTLEGAQKKDDVSVTLLNNQFQIEQDGVKAETDLAVKVDPDANSISLVTKNGDVALAVLPKEVETKLETDNILERIEDIKIAENTDHSDTNQLVYKVTGQKDAKLFALLTFHFPVSVTVGATTGERISTQQGFILRFLGFLFTK